jgi:putative transcriptional regulator
MVNAYACNRIQPNLDTLQQIAEILQVDLKELITDKNERQ